MWPSILIVGGGGKEEVLYKCWVLCPCTESNKRLVLTPPVGVTSASIGQRQDGAKMHTEYENDLCAL